MAGNASSTTVFFPVPARELPHDVLAQFTEFVDFAQANSINAPAGVGTHDVQAVPGMATQYYGRYVKDGEPFDFSINLQMASNSEDADIAEIRQFFGFLQPATISWEVWKTRATRTDAIIPPPVGSQLANGNYQMNTNVPVGTRLVMGGVTYEAVQPLGMFTLQWQKLN